MWNPPRLNFGRLVNKSLRQLRAREREPALNTF
jgi:hypothetical protein